MYKETRLELVTRVQGYKKNSLPVQNQRRELKKRKEGKKKKRKEIAKFFALHANVINEIIWTVLFTF